MDGEGIRRVAVGGGAMLLWKTDGRPHARQQACWHGGVNRWTIAAASSSLSFRIALAMHLRGSVVRRSFGVDGWQVRMWVPAHWSQDDDNVIVIIEGKGPVKGGGSLRRRGRRMCTH